MSSAITTPQLMLLSPRERQVLDLMVNGEADKFIAESLHITYHTTKNYLRIIGIKLRIRGYGKRVKLISLLATGRIPLPKQLLTPRQYLLSSLVCKGKGYKEIASELTGNINTIKQTMHNVFDILGCDSAYGLCAKYTAE